MFSLYSAINGRQATQEEIDLASGKTLFDSSKHTNLIKSIQASQLDIRHALQNQANAAAVSCHHILLLPRLTVFSHRDHGIKLNSRACLLSGSS
jgi:hypothetical protein